MSSEAEKEANEFVGTLSGKVYTNAPEVFPGLRQLDCCPDQEWLGEIQVVLHKGMLDRVEARVYAQAIARSEIVYANEFCIIFSLHAVEPFNNDIKSFYHFALEQIPSLNVPSKEPVKAKSNFYAYLGENTAICDAAHGQKIYIDTRDLSLAPHLIREGAWEPWVTRFFQQQIKPGDTFFDLGANCGYFSLLAAHLAGQHGQVLAFEPQSRMADLLSMSIAVNGLENQVMVMRCALGESDGVADMVKDPKFAGGAAILAKSERMPEQSFEVPVRTIDSLMRELNASGSETIIPNVIKIDVEGYEPFVYKGMRDLLSHCGQLIILMEFSPSRYKYHQQDPFEFYRSTIADGFIASELCTDGTERPFDNMTIERLLYEERFTDLILRKGHD